MPRRPSRIQYINLRVPKPEYDKLKLVREQLVRNPEYSWVEHLALGTLIGFLASQALERLSVNPHSSLKKLV